MQRAGESEQRENAKTGASPARPVAAGGEGPSLEKSFDLVGETLEALTVNERAHGFGSLNDLLLEAQKRGLLKL